MLIGRSPIGSLPAAPVSLGTSVPIALLVSGCVLAVAWWVRLPLLAGAALYLFFAVESDVRTARIPNWLNLGALLGAMGGAYLVAGPAGFATAMHGAGIAFVLSFALFAIGVFGAGDGKGVIVLGAMHGAAELPGLYFWMLLAGGLLALVRLLRRGETMACLRRWFTSLRIFLATLSFVHEKPPSGSAAAGGIPFAICMGIGSSAQMLWGSPW